MCHARNRFNPALIFCCVKVVVVCLGGGGGAGVHVPAAEHTAMWHRQLPQEQTPQ